MNKKITYKVVEFKTSDGELEEFYERISEKELVKLDWLVEEAAKERSEYAERNKKFKVRRKNDE